MNLPPNVPQFVHTTIGNGIILSTCLLCAKIIASPTPENLKIAEQSHLCPGGFPMPQRTQA